MSFEGNNVDWRKVRFPWKLCRLGESDLKISVSWLRPAEAGSKSSRGLGNHVVQPYFMKKKVRQVKVAKLPCGRIRTQTPTFQSSSMWHHPTTIIPWVPLFLEPWSTMFWQSGQGSSLTAPRALLLCFLSCPTLLYTGWGKTRFIVVHMENNTRVNCASCTHNCKPIFAPFCIRHNLSSE